MYLPGLFHGLCSRVRSERSGLGALAVDIVLCSWARHFTLTVSLSTQVYTEMNTDEINKTGGNSAMD